MGKHIGQPICIECPNTIFHLYVKTEAELAKIEIFMGNVRFLERLALNDIYNWCNRQKIEYDTRFNYHKGANVWRTIRDYMIYSRQKIKYQLCL